MGALLSGIAIVIWLWPKRALGQRAEAPHV
jgi:hypothetical protein